MHLFRTTVPTMEKSYTNIHGQFMRTKHTKGYRYVDRRTEIVGESTSWTAVCLASCALSDWLQNWVFYRWRELPQVFVTTKDVFCRDKHMFVTTKLCRQHDKTLSWQKWYLWQLPPRIGFFNSPLIIVSCCKVHWSSEALCWLKPWYFGLLMKSHQSCFQCLPGQLWQEL